MKFIITTLFTIISSILFGYMFSEMWGLYAVPLGLKQISVPHAIGILVLFDMILNLRGIAYKELEIEEIIHISLTSIIHRIILFIIGYITYLFM